MWSCLTSIPCPTIGQIVVVIIGFYIFKHIVSAILHWRRASQKQKLHTENWTKNVVYLYQFPRSPIPLPNLSPFCLKLETWLKVKSSWMARSKEGLLPFVELNGEHIADSQLIIHKLQKHFNKMDGVDKQTPEQRALSRSIDRMVECSLLHAMACFKVIEHTAEFLSPEVSGMPFPRFVTNLIALLANRMAKGRLRAQGMYKHDRVDILDIMRRDLQAISDALGKKKYIISNDHPTSVDCTVFGHLASVYYLPYDQPLKQMLHSDFVNIRDLLERIRTEIWASDWKQK